jgi:HK97 family phage prohead protease
MSVTHTFRVPFAVHSAQASPTAPCRFEGYASVFGTLIDAHIPTIVERGAFAETIVHNRSRIKILYQHDETQPIGKPLELREDSHGLFLRAELSTTARGQEVAQLLREGIITELSIGFDPIEFHLDRSGPEPVRRITKVVLFEISPVTFAANRDAKITQVHARNRAGGRSIESQIAAFQRMCDTFRSDELRRHQLNLLGSMRGGR